MKAINVTELEAHLSKYLRLASRGSRFLVKDPDSRQSVGFALEDLASASLAYSRAAAAGVGTRVTF